MLNDRPWTVETGVFVFHLLLCRCGELQADEAGLNIAKPARMTEGQVDDQGHHAPPPRHRHGDSTLALSDVTQQQAPEETRHTAESRVQDSDSEDKNQQVDFEKQAEPAASHPGTAPTTHHSQPVAPDGGWGSAPATHHSQPVAPDGGWGWIVLLATILVMALTLAFPSCIAIFYTDLQTEFNTSNTETSWVPAIMVAVQHAGGPLCSMLVERWGCRVTVMVGGCLSGLGMAVASFARTIGELYITGAVTGLGFCFTFQASVTIMGHYFVRRRAFANAMSSTGTALGLITLPQIANFLDGQFGWRGSFLVLGGMLLNCCVCGAVMRPVGPAIKHHLGSTAGTPNDRRREQRGETEGLRTALLGFLAFLRRHMAFDLLVSNVRYRTYAIGVTWMMLSFIVPLVYVVPYAMENNMSQNRAALLMSILGLVSISVRPVAAMLFSLPRCRGTGRFVYVFAAAVLVNGLSNCIGAASPSFEVLLLYMVIFGLSMSLIGTLLFTCLMETVEMNRFHSALGLMSMMESVTLLIGPPLAGILVDSTGQYSYIFYACSISGTLSGIFLMGSFYVLDSQREQEEKTKKTSDICQKPSLILAPDCEYSNVPSCEGQLPDTDHVTDV